LSLADDAGMGAGSERLFLLRTHLQERAGPAVGNGWPVELDHRPTEGCQ